MDIEIGYGTAPQTLQIPSERILDILYPNPLPAVPGESSILKNALDHPISSAPLSDLVRGKKNHRDHQRYHQTHAL